LQLKTKSMTRSKKPLPILENITITDIAAEGKSIARVDDMVVFVPFTVPGDIVDLQVRKKKHHYCEAEVIRFIKYSDVRQQPMCSHFGVCGGCKWQNLPYEEQLRAKQKQVFDQLTRIGKIELPEFRPIMGSAKTKEYRNKLEFGCCNKRWLTREQVASGTTFDNMNAIGFHITGAFDKILPIDKCWLMDDLHNEIRNEIRDFALKNNYSFFDLRRQVGLLRDIMIRNSNTGEWMVLVQFHYEEEGDEAKSKLLLQDIADKFPQITSLLYVDNQKCNDTFGDLDIQVFKGNDHIYETMSPL
jgi:23S rRNA (uracil1939-C5)-methyltransferase